MASLTGESTTNAIGTEEVATTPELKAAFCKPSTSPWIRNPVGGIIAFTFNESIEFNDSLADHGSTPASIAIRERSERGVAKVVLTSEAMVQPVVSKEPTGVFAPGDLRAISISSKEDGDTPLIESGSGWRAIRDEDDFVLSISVEFPSGATIIAKLRRRRRTRPTANLVRAMIQTPTNRI